MPVVEIFYFQSLYFEKEFDYNYFNSKKERWIMVCFSVIGTQSKERGIGEWGWEWEWGTGNGESLKWAIFKSGTL